MQAIYAGNICRQYMQAIIFPGIALDFFPGKLAIFLLGTL
jgi:hypothetical protein